MKKRFSDEQIIVFSARQMPGFLSVSFAVSTLFPMPPFTPGVKSMAVPEVKRLKSPEEENAWLKKLLAEAMLDKEALQVALGRKY